MIGKFRKKMAASSIDTKSKKSPPHKIIYHKRIPPEKRNRTHLIFGWKIFSFLIIMAVYPFTSHSYKCNKARQQVAFLCKSFQNSFSNQQFLMTPICLPIIKIVNENRKVYERIHRKIHIERERKTNQSIFPTRT